MTTVNLQIIAGPPNSGRAGEMRRRFQAALPRDPLLIVPTSEDVARFEEELCADGAVLGGAVRTFEGLFDAVATATGTAGPPQLDGARRRGVVREALKRTERRALRAPGPGSGLARLVDEAIADVQTALVEPAELGERVRRARAPTHLTELAHVYDAYTGLRDELGYTDAAAHQAATLRALAKRPEPWGARPVLLYGFDDLTEAQLELVSTLARTAEVTIAIAFEERPALAARARLRERLTERGGEVVAELRPEPQNTESETLFHLERSFLDDRAEPREPDGDGLLLLEAAGERGEAELVAARLRELLAAGEPAEEIAVVLRSPATNATVWEEALSACGVPVAVDGGVPFPATATGRGALAALRAASPEGTAADLISYLRTPGVAPSGRVDRLERHLRTSGPRSAEEALAAWEGHELVELRELRDAGTDGPQLARALARTCRVLAQLPLRRKAATPGGSERRELWAGEEAAQHLESLAELPLGSGPSDLAAALEEVRVPLWRPAGSPPRGRVRVLSPYRARVRRIRHLVVASLQDGEFPRRDPGNPLLGDAERSFLGLPPRAAVEEEERYLFHACLARPTHTLTLSRRSVDDEGGSVVPSPFLADVRSLLAPGPPEVPGAPDPLRERIVRARGPAETVVAPARAPSHRDLARSLAAFPGERARWARAPEAGALIDAVQAAAARARMLPGPLRDPEVLAALAARPALSASQLEEYRLCSYRWFVEHELKPQPLEPDPEQRADGTIVHSVLERLYRDPPAGTVPRKDTMEQWRHRAWALIDEQAAEAGIADEGSIGWRARRRRLCSHIERFLRREATGEGVLRPEPELLEVAFGLHGEEVAQVGDVPLRGKIDRVDATQDSEGGRLGLIRDYKLSRNAVGARKLRERGKLQLQLYALALRERGIEPIGALYEPLAAGEGTKPRGLVRKDHAELIGDPSALTNTDLMEPQAFEAELSDAAELAGELAAGIRAGRIARDPLGGECPSWCTFAAICRRERGVVEEVEDDEANGPGT